MASSLDPIASAAISSAVIAPVAISEAVIAEAAIALGRRYLIFEIDPATADLARERIRNTQPPLPGINETQLALSLEGAE